MDGGRRLAGSTLALTVHGPAGAVDLVVPPEASVDDVAREYAAQCRLQFAPTLHTRVGQELGAGPVAGRARHPQRRRAGRRWGDPRQRG